MRRGGLTAALSLLVLATSGPVAAEKLIWIDDKGGIHSEVRDAPGDESESVELYVTSWCPSCKQAIKYLRARGIAYKAYDIEKDRSAALRRSRLDKRGGVPLAVINGKKILGFSPAAYERALEGER